MTGTARFTLCPKGRATLPQPWRNHTDLVILPTGYPVALISTRDVLSRLNRAMVNAAVNIRPQGRTFRFQLTSTVRDQLGVVPGDDVVFWGCGSVGLVSSIPYYNQVARRFGRRVLKETQT